MNLKQIILYLTFAGVTLINAQTAVKDTIYTGQQVLYPKYIPDTVNFNLIKNDSGSVKVLAIYVNCVRYPAGATQRTIKNFGKIIVNSNGVGRFITTLPTVHNPTTYFHYSIESNCGVSKGVVYIRDSSIYWTDDTTKVYAKHSVYGYGYYLALNGKYYIQYNSVRTEVTKTEYDYALKNR